MIYMDGEFYDLMHSSVGKNYGVEAERIVDRILALNPKASSLLDVACGTGSHLLHFSKIFTDSAGIDISPEMLKIAREKNPGSVFTQGDLASFTLNRQFDVVTCFFSAIGYVADEPTLKQAAATFSSHLNPRGIALIEAWLTPDSMFNEVRAFSVVHEEKAFAQVVRRERIGSQSITTMEFVSADSEGTHHRTERHVLGLFTSEQYVEAFTAAGLSTTFEPDAGPVGRGLITAVKP